MDFRLSGTSQLRTVLRSVVRKALEPEVATLKGVLLEFVVWALMGIKEGDVLVLYCFTWPLVEGGPFSAFLVVVLATDSSLERRMGSLCS